MNKIRLLIILPLIAILLAGFSSDNSYRWHIGVSQCVGGKWREKANREMITAQHLSNHEVKVDIVSANNDSRRQVRQIDSLVAAGVDLLVISPNEQSTVSPAIERARRAGIPVILFDRKAAGTDYTAYIGGDNIEAGRAMGNYTLSLLRERSYDHRPRVLEITGGTSSSPAIDRHRGFSSVISGHTDIDYSFVNTDWTTEEVYKAMRQWLTTHPTPDIVFCHSDLAAFSARRAATDLHCADGIRFLGIDGLPGKGEGIDAVDKGLLAGTYIYPTHGDEIIALALRVLKGEPFKRNNIMHSVIVTPDNAPILMQSSAELQRQSNDLMTLQEKLDDYFGLYHAQRTVLVVAIGAILMLCIALVLIWRAVVQLRRAGRKIRSLNREQTLFYTNARHQLRTPLTLIEGPLHELAARTTLHDDDRRLVDILARNVSQLSRIVNDVLTFRNEVAATVDDSSAATEKEKEMARTSIRKGRVEMLKTENSDMLPSVLVVDDNDDMRQYLRTILADKYYVVEAADGESGLRLARESVPDIIVSDVMMPVMDGLQFCRKIKDDNITSHIPVILLTARSTEHQQVEGLYSGADAYMTKPFSAELLLARISNLLISRQKLRHLFDGREKEEETTLSTPDRNFMTSLKKAIDSRMADSNLKMDDLGAAMGMSRVQLYRKVKALTGLSPVELLREVRLQRAHKLLQTTDLTVAQVAYEVGFATPGYFSSCFKKQFGKYPTDVKATDKE